MGKEFQAVLRPTNRLDGAGGDGIEHRLNEGDYDIATLDTAIYKIRRALARITATPGRGNWADELKAATDAYNETPHGAIHKEAPENVSGNSEESKSMQFDLQKQNAEKYAQQSEVSLKKVEKLKQAKAFRMEIKQRSGTGLKRRADDHTYGKKFPATEDQLQPNSGVVTAMVDGKLKYVPIRRVLPVNEESTNANDPPDREDQRTKAKKRCETEELYKKVNQYLNMPRTTKNIRTHIGSEGMQTIKDKRIQTVAKFMKLWDFRLVEGKW
jgi:hypothetical protein